MKTMIGELIYFTNSRFIYSNDNSHKIIGKIYENDIVIIIGEVGELFIILCKYGLCKTQDYRIIYDNPYL
jgi:D-arabinose 5-phosphate isomerase GutQ